MKLLEKPLKGLTSDGRPLVEYIVALCNMRVLLGRKKGQ